ncbi:MAG: hypothetical protein AAFQ47_15570 [Pseudomonadota bacterium]
MADAHGAVIYDTDAAMGEHASRCSSHACPQLAHFKRMTMNRRWVERSPKEMFQTFHWFAGEGFSFIVDDLLARPSDRLVIAEGFRLLPLLVLPLLQDKRHAIWLLPTPAFRRRAFDARGTTWEIPRKTSNAELALANTLARDALFTDRVRDEVSGLGLHALDVDGSQSEDVLEAVIGDLLFG